MLYNSLLHILHTPKKDSNEIVLFIRRGGQRRTRTVFFFLFREKRNNDHPNDHISQTISLIFLEKTFRKIFSNIFCVQYLAMFGLIQFLFHDIRLIYKALNFFLSPYQQYHLHKNQKQKDSDKRESSTPSRSVLCNEQR